MEKSVLLSARENVKNQWMQLLLIDNDVSVQEDKLNPFMAKTKLEKISDEIKPKPNRDEL